MDSKRIAQMLGASRTETLPTRDAQGPLGLLLAILCVVVAWSPAGREDGSP